MSSPRPSHLRRSSSKTIDIPIIPNGSASLSRYLNGHGSPFSPTSASPTSSSKSIFHIATRTNIQTTPKILKHVEDCRNWVTRFRVTIGSDFECERILKGSRTLPVFKKFINAQRIRDMPAEGSVWDNTLRWAFRFGEELDSFVFITSPFFPGSTEIAENIWGCCKALLLIGARNVTALQRFFDELYHVSVALEMIRSNNEIFASSTDLQEVASAILALLHGFAIAVMLHFKVNAIITNKTLEGCDTIINPIINEFKRLKESLELSIWIYKLRQSPEISGTGDVTLTSLKSWLKSKIPSASQVLACEGTCGWFEETLTEFKEGSDQLLLVTGAPGCGKSVLYSWIVHRLRMHREDILIHHSLDATVESGASSLTIVRSLTLQLLNKSVGNVDLYKRLANLYNASTKNPEAYSSVEIENSLWQIFDATAVASAQLNLVIDGLDAIEGGNVEAEKLIQRFKTIIEKNGPNSLNCVILSRQFQPKLTIKLKEFAITDSQTLYDIRCFVSQFVNNYSGFGGLTGDQKSDIIDRVVAKAAGSFLAANLLLQTIIRYGTLADILKNLGSSSSDGVPGLLDILLAGIDLKSPDVQKIICWLLVAQQPMFLVNLKDLLEIRTEPGKAPQFVRRLAWDVEADIIKPCGSLIAVEGGVVRFTHPSLKEHLFQKLKTTGFGVTLEQCHFQVFSGLMSYIHACNLPTGPDTDFEPADASLFGSSLQTHGLLLYCIRYWVLHFKQSTCWKGGKIDVNSNLIALFPTTISFPRLEGFIGRTDAFTEALFLEFAEIRRTILGNTASTIHALINLSRCKTICGNVRGSVDGIYECWKLSKTCFGSQSPQCRSLALLYIHSTSKIGWSDTSEEVYKWLWAFHKDTKTSIDLEIVEMMKVYIEQLRKKNRHDEATRLYKELWKICGSTFGDTHVITTNILELLIGSLSSSGGDVDEFLDICLGHLSVYEKTLKPWDELRISAVIRLAFAYERKLNISSAQDTFRLAIEKLQRCTTAGEELTKIHIAWVRLHMELEALLSKNGRKGEVVQQLGSFWIEIKTFVANLRESADLESLITYLVLLADRFDKVGLHQESEELYEALWALFRGFTHLFQHPDVLKVGGCLAGFRGKRNPGSEEDLLKQILDLCRTEGPAAQQEVDAYLRLTVFYENHQAWQKLLDTCKAALQRLWPQLLLPKVEKIYLPKEYRKESLKLGYRLATAYIGLKIPCSAELTYFRIFEACSTSLMLGEDDILIALTRLCDFLEKNEKNEEAIKVFSKVYEQMRTSLSPRDGRKISIGLRLADLFVRCSHPKRAEEVYLHLWSALSSGKITSQLFEIVGKLSKFYVDNPTFQNAENFYDLFFKCIFSVEVQIDFTADPQMVFDIYQRLTAILKPKKGSTTIIKKLTDDLKKFYLVNFGDQHISYLQIVYRLTIMVEDEGGVNEAIRDYQWLLAAFKNKSLQGELQIIIVDIKKRLAALLSRTKERCKDAEQYYRELWIFCKNDHGPASDQSIEYLRLFISFLKDQNRLQDALNILESTVIEILSEEENPHFLYEGAKHIANLYILLGCSVTGLAFSKEIRKFILQFSIDRCKPEIPRFKNLVLRAVNGFITDRCYQILLSTFESVLFNPNNPERVSDFLSVLKAVLKETELYEVWLRSSKFGESLDFVLSAGSRLRIFLLAQRREDESAYIFKEMWKYFESDYNLFIKRNRKPTMKDFPASELEAFFKKCLEQCARDDHSRESKLIQSGTAQVEAYLIAKDINSAFTIAIWTYSWIEAEGKFAHVFKLLFLLTSSNVKAHPDEGLRATIAAFTQEILRSILSRESGIGVSWTTMSIEELNRLLILLGGEKSWAFMLVIIKWLWDQRSEHDDTWTPDLVTAIGRRLCDTYMVLNRKEDALQLCERIHYNYKRVFGELNSQTLLFADLLVQLYASALHYDKAMILSEKVLQALTNPLHKGELKKGKEVDIIFRQLNLLKYSRSMKGSWQNPEENYVSLISQLHVLYMQKHSRWDEIADFKFWSAKAVDVKDGPFAWEPPTIWNILEDESITWKGGVPSIAEPPKNGLPGVRSPKRLSRTHTTSSEKAFQGRESEFEKFSKTSFQLLFSE
ncbi:hypothetical protein TWF481_000792 [Arthrobotrys musiformis]|uniref:Nephrocystin 3-like N-terminal domain-containing protein n=1 Tax=Arthrobotrys musiformis TaxID=47236 RepID=A0AAV9WQF4_9PEZI